jgi:hypothetical protein
MKLLNKKQTSENNTLIVSVMSIQRNGSDGFDLLISLDFRLANDFKTKNTNASSMLCPFYVLHSTQYRIYHISNRFTVYHNRYVVNVEIS